MRLKDKVAIVTGGTRGIGRAIVLKLVQEGALAAIIYSNSDKKAAAVCEEVHRLGATARAYKCDVADYDDVVKCIANIQKDFGSIDIIVNNAGIIRDNIVFNMSVEDFNQVVDINLLGTFHVIKACNYHLIMQNHGKIINISSITGLNGNYGQSNYAASKAGIIGLTKSVAKELGERNICCNVVAPGIILTDMTKESMDEDILKNYTALKRVGKPEDVANVVAFLASDESDYITGAVIKVDGGMVS